MQPSDPIKSPSNHSSLSQGGRPRTSKKSTRSKSTTSSTRRYNQNQSPDQRLPPASLADYQPPQNPLDYQRNPGYPPPANPEGYPYNQHGYPTPDRRTDPNVRQELQQGLQHIKACSTVTQQAINRHPEMNTLRYFQETVSSLDQAVSDVLRAALSISQQSIDIARSHQSFKDQQAGYNQGMERMPQETPTQFGDFGQGQDYAGEDATAEQQQWVQRLATLLESLHEHLASPPHGIELRTAADLLTDLRTFVSDEPQRDQRFQDQQSGQQHHEQPPSPAGMIPQPQSPINPGYQPPQLLGPGVGPHRVDPQHPQGGPKVPGVAPQLPSPMLSPTQWSEQMEQLYSGMRQSYEAAGSQPAVRMLYRDNIDRGNQQLDLLRGDPSYKRVGGGL